MDPNATLRDIREMIESLAMSQSTDNLLDLGEELASAFEQLDNWLTGGGFLPDEWIRVRRMMGRAMEDRD
jgi:hypothetical protein